jgi:hypothetical protein
MAGGCKENSPSFEIKTAKIGYFKGSISISLTSDFEFPALSKAFNSILYFPGERGPIGKIFSSMLVVVANSLSLTKI